MLVVNWSVFSESTKKVETIFYFSQKEREKESTIKRKNAERKNSYSRKIRKAKFSWRHIVKTQSDVAMTRLYQSSETKGVGDEVSKRWKRHRNRRIAERRMLERKTKVPSRVDGMEQWTEWNFKRSAHVILRRILIYLIMIPSWRSQIISLERGRPVARVTRSGGTRYSSILIAEVNIRVGDTIDAGVSEVQSSELLENLRRRRENARERPSSRIE